MKTISLLPLTSVLLCGVVLYPVHSRGSALESAFFISVAEKYYCASQLVSERAFQKQ